MSLVEPVGGIVLRSQDFAPSILFSVLHGLLIPLCVYRMCRKKTQTFIINSFGSFCVERVILFSLRASVATGDPKAESHGLTDYMQVTFAMASVYLLFDVSALLRCILVNSTYTADTYPDRHLRIPSVLTIAPPASNSPLIYSEKTSLWSSSIWSKSGNSVQSSVSLPDQPRRRYWFRRMHDAMQVLVLAAIVPGVLGNTVVAFQVKHPEKSAQRYINMRYASTSMVLFLILWIATAALKAKQRLTRVNPLAIHYLLALCGLLAIPYIYRLSVFHHTTTDIRTGSNNTTVAKAMFYTFHILPEFLTCLILLTINVRQIFDTGVAGDVFWADETPEKREKRLAKEEAKKAKKLAKKEERRRKKEGGEKV